MGSTSRCFFLIFFLFVLPSFPSFSPIHPLPAAARPIVQVDAPCKVVAMDNTSPDNSGVVRQSQAADIDIEMHH
jgi:hypothetical protein